MGTNGQGSGLEADGNRVDSGMVEVRVSSLRFDSTSDSCVIVLQERDGDRAVAIWIGRREAESIVIHVQNMAHPRPLTHDLVSSIIHGVGAQLRRLYISRLENRTFYAELQLLVNAKPVNVDTRPSDGIAIAIRLDAPMFVAEALLMNGAQLAADLSSSDASADLESAGDADVDDEEPSPGFPKGSHSKERFTAEELKHYLERLRPEDFGKFNP